MPMPCSAPGSLARKTKNNGVLLLVAPKEHRTRIEVGYGLEGTLTDLLSKVIITNAMVPRFKTGDYGGGIERGVDDIIAVLTTDSSDWQKRPDLRADRQGQGDSYAPLIALIVIVIIIILILRSPHRSDILSFIAGMLLSGGGGGGGGGNWSSGSGSDDTFSGGGGSSGGGRRLGRLVMVLSKEIKPHLRRDSMRRKPGPMARSSASSPNLRLNMPPIRSPGRRCSP